jgi:hypothetical protein
MMIVELGVKLVVLVVVVEVEEVVVLEGLVS